MSSPRFLRALRIAMTILGGVCLVAGLGAVLPWALVTNDPEAWLILIVSGLLVVASACLVGSLASVERTSRSR